MADYLDGELSLDFRALFDAHLDQCDDCSRELTDMRDTIRLLRTLPNPEPPVDLVSDVMQRIADGEAQPNWFERFLDQLSQWVIPRIAIPVTAVAAALMLTILTGDLSLGDLDLRPAAQQPPPAVASVKVAPVRAPSSVLSVSPVAVPSPERANRQLQLFASGRSRLATGSPFDQYEGESRSGRFLYRVATDLRGPIRSQPRDGDVAYRMFSVSSTPIVGPYSPATMPPSLPSVLLGRTDFGSGQLRVRQAPGGITPVKVTRMVPATRDGGEALSPGERRRRELDTRLGQLKEDPPGFAQGMAKFSLAEQELWLRELAARAEETGDVGRVMSALEGSGDQDALRLAREFELAVSHNRASWAAAEARSSSD
jgi:hypothetical protein